jgi:phage terminase large subunit-like protein
MPQTVLSSEELNFLRSLSADDLAKIMETLTPEERKELEFALDDIQLNEELKDPPDWIQKNFYIPELNGPIQLAEYQERCLREAFRKDPATGLFIYSTVVWSDIKKSSKSTITAAVALYFAHLVRYGRIQIVANDLKQADTRVGGYARLAIDLNRDWKKNFSVKNNLISLPNRSEIESIPIDPTGEAGGNSDLIIYSELWGANSTKQKRMWTEATLPPGKFGRSMRWVETYAGIEGESETLEQLYENGVKRGVQIWPDLEAYANPAARLFVLWNTVPRLPWQTPAYYASEAVLLTPSEFERVHRNKWSRSVNSFVPAAWVDTARGLVAPKILPNEPLVVGIDAGTSADSFAISVVSITTVELETDAGYYSYRLAHVRMAFEWIPEPGEKLQYSDPISPTTGKPEPLDPRRPAPETVIRDLAEKFHVVMFVYDPYQLHNMANNLTNAGVGYFVEMNQNMGGKRAKADKNLFDLIRDRRLTISDDRVAQHIKNANASTESDGLRLKKRNIHAKIDLAVATSMALFEAFELNLG